MRQAFINTLIQLAEQDVNLYLLTADMGFGLVEQFATRFPKQYINVGVAEQNMIGVATGLALEGKKVFCYSIANFPTMRCLEQIRNDICYHNLPVCIVSGGAGLWYGALGMTHHAVEDIAVMRCLPNMFVLSPQDETTASICTKSAYLSLSPCYIRMTKSITEPVDYRIIKHSNVIIIATGGVMVGNAHQASGLLTRHGIETSLLPIIEIKPLNSQRIRDAINEASVDAVIITIEEHSRIGGLGSAVAEILAGMKQHPPLVRMGTEDRYPDTAMSYEELLAVSHLDVDGIVKEVLDALH